MREGVNKVALRLFEHNEKAYHAAVRMMEQYGKATLFTPSRNKGVSSTVIMEEQHRNCALLRHI